MYKNMCARQNGPKWTDAAKNNIVPTLTAHFYVQSCTTLLKKCKISCINWRKKKVHMDGMLSMCHTFLKVNGIQSNR